MIDILVNLLIIFFTYILIFSIYYAVTVVSCRNITRFVRRFKFASCVPNNIAVIVYVDNQNTNISSLLEMLNKQEYQKENYQTHIILDGCNDELGNMLEFIGGAKVYRLGDENFPLGKNEAINFVIESLLIDRLNINAFVFLNPNYKVSEKFLSSVNVGLLNNDIITGMTQIDYAHKDKLSFIEKINIVYKNYQNRILNFGRSVLGLISPIDSNLCAIKKEVFEKIGYVDFETSYNELSYTLSLTKEKLYSIFNPCIMALVNVENYNEKNVSLLFRFELFIKYFKSIFNTNHKFVEFQMSLLHPNFILLILMYVSVFIFSYVYYFFYDFKIVVYVGLFLALTFFVSLIIAKFSLREVYLLSFKPFIPFIRLFSYIFKFEKIIKFNKKTQSSVINREKITVDVIVTDGRNNLECFLDLIQEDGMSKVVFRFKNKKYTSSTFLRMYDAVKDITDKLEDHGFKLKICQNCIHFKPEIDGSINMVKGFCTRKVNESEEQSSKESLALELSDNNNDQLLNNKKVLWFCCKYFVPNDVNKLIDLNEFKNQKNLNE